MHEGPKKRSWPISRVLCWTCCQIPDSHSSRRRVTAPLKQPTREPREQRECSPIWSCSGWGLPCPTLLLDRRCALTAPFQPCLILLAKAIGGLFSVALSVASRRPAVSRHPTLRSPDFPPRANAQRLSGQLRAHHNIACIGVISVKAVTQRPMRDPIFR